MIIRLTLFTFLLFTVWACSSDPVKPTIDPEPEVDVDLEFTPTTEFDFKADGYTNFNFSGFNLLVQTRIIDNETALANSALGIIETDLARILEFSLNEQIKSALLAVPIFLDLNTTTGGAVYHPSAEWLSQNGYITEKAQSVEISNIRNFINWTKQNQPYMLLHELAHAYHHRIHNFSNADITNAYDHAIAVGLYTNVSYHSGNDNYTTASKAYGLNDEKEFFAELTEAYFGLNDYYPFVRSELETYDPAGFDMIERVWEQD